jgi:uncharacterized protein (TIRG00374 family)
MSQPTAAPPEPAAAPARRWIGNFLRVAVSVSILVWIFSRVPLGDIRSVLAGVSRRGLALFFLLALLSCLLTTWRWQLLVLDQGLSLGYGAALRLTLVGYFFNNFFLGATGGDLVKAAVAGQGTGRTASLLSTVLLDRIIGLAVVVVIGAGGLLAYLPFAGRDVQVQLALPGVAVSVSLAGFLAAYLVYYNRTLRGSAPVRWAVERLPFRRALGEMDAVFQTFRKRPRLIAATAGITVLSQGAFIASVYVGGRALGITEAAPLHYVVLVPLLEIAVGLPISFGGWGVGEAAYQMLFGLAGVAPARAVALSLLIKTVGILFGLPGAAVFATQRRPAGGAGSPRSPVQDPRSSPFG